MSKSSMLWGILLIVIGIFFILNQYFVGISWGRIWPIFILLPGLLMEISYFANPKAENAGVLIPGGILTVLGIFFFYSVFTNFKHMDKLWPIFIFAPAFGLFQLYLFRGKQKALLIPVTVLGVIGLIFLLINMGRLWVNIWGLILIIVGILIIYGGRKK